MSCTDCRRPLLITSVLVVRVGSLCVCREVKGPDGKMQYLEPCSPSEPGAIETTLTDLAEKGLAPQVCHPFHLDPSAPSHLEPLFFADATIVSGCCIASQQTQVMVKRGWPWLILGTEVERANA